MTFEQALAAQQKAMSDQAKWKSRQSREVSESIQKADAEIKAGKRDGYFGPRVAA